MAVDCPQARIQECLKSISPFSDSVQTALKQLGEKPVNIAKACATLELDPILAAAILRLANPSFYGFARKITNVKDACVLLGVHTMRQVVVAYSTVAAFPAKHSGGLNRDVVWRHCVTVAVAAKLLAEASGNDGDEAFVAGVLHDIGRFILDQCLKEAYIEVITHSQGNNCSLLVTERELLGIDHGLVGSMAIEQWKLPSEFGLVAAHHSHPSVDDNPHALVDLIHVANVLALGLFLPKDGKATMERLSPLALERLVLDWYQVEALLPKIDSMSKDFISRLTLRSTSERII